MYDVDDGERLFDSLSPKPDEHAKNRPSSALEIGTTSRRPLFFPFRIPVSQIRKSPTILVSRRCDLAHPFHSIENATTINGKGRYAGGPQVPLSVTSVQKGKRYRLRFINISCGPTYQVSIDNHNMTIIEADGVETNPLTVNSFDM